jgi:hypothetical protein
MTQWLIAVPQLTIISSILATKVEQGAAEVTVSKCHGPIFGTKKKTYEILQLSPGHRNANLPIAHLDSGQKRSKVNKVASEANEHADAQSSTKAIREPRETSTRRCVGLKHDEGFIIGNCDGW